MLMSKKFILFHKCVYGSYDREKNVYFIYIFFDLNY